MLGSGFPYRGDVVPVEVSGLSTSYCPVASASMSLLAKVGGGGWCFFHGKNWRFQNKITRFSLCAFFWADQIPIPMILFGHLRWWYFRRNELCHRARGLLLLFRYDGVRIFIQVTVSQNQFFFFQKCLVASPNPVFRSSGVRPSLTNKPTAACSWPTRKGGNQTKMPWVWQRLASFAAFLLRLCCRSTAACQWCRTSSSSLDCKSREGRWPLNVWRWSSNSCSSIRVVVYLGWLLLRLSRWPIIPRSLDDSTHPFCGMFKGIKGK